VQVGIGIEGVSLGIGRAGVDVVGAEVGVGVGVEVREGVEVEVANGLAPRVGAGVEVGVGVGVVGVRISGGVELGVD